MAVDREGLREALARYFWAHSSEPIAFAGDWDRVVAEAKTSPHGKVGRGVKAFRDKADALIAGPLSDLLTKADSAERMEVERAARPDEVPVEMIAAAWEVVRDRYPQGRVLGPGPGFREAIMAALAQRPLCDLEARIVEAETTAEVDREFAGASRRQAAAAQADVARLSAEVEALRATIRSASEAVHADSGYSSFPTTIDSEEASNLRRCRDIVVSAAALSRADKADSRERGNG